MEADRVNFGRNVPRHLVEENPKKMGKNQKKQVLSTLFLTKQSGKNARAGGGVAITAPVRPCHIASKTTLVSS